MAAAALTAQQKSQQIKNEFHMRHPLCGGGALSVCVCMSAKHR